MFLIDLFSWWYLESWPVLLTKMSHALKLSGDFFSIGSLSASLFKPYKQTLVGQNGIRQTLGQKIGDAFISRAVGFFVRLTIILAGIIFIVAQISIFFLVLVLWPFLPLLPLALVALSLINFGF